MTLQGGLLELDIVQLTDLIPGEVEPCSCCNDVWLIREMKVDYSGEFVCEACINREYSYCHECGEWVPDSKIEHIGECRYCPECAGERWNVAI